VSDVRIKLKDLAELARGDTLRIISSRTGKVLVYSYHKEKHEHLGELEITGIFTELELSGTVKNFARSRLVCWAYEDDFRKLQAEKELGRYVRS
jgi:hypothetical protein